MTIDGDLEIFLPTHPGFEPALYAEVRRHRFKAAKAVPGGVMVRGTWRDAWRANLVLRGASRVVVRIGGFRAAHLSDLEARARRVPWSLVLRPDVPFRVEATCKSSRIYHSGAATERVSNAIGAALGVPAAPPSSGEPDLAQPSDAAVCIRVRIEDDRCTLAIDTSGELLHKRGFKQAVAKAPMRETLAALFLGQCGYTGAEPVLDPMCGSGTFVVEAAEIAAGLLPGRGRRFAFELLAGFDAAAFEQLKDRLRGTGAVPPGVRCYGRDRDPGAIRMCVDNAARAGVAASCDFAQCDIADLAAPEGPPGLVIVNPPYGGRIGDAVGLQSLYRNLGRVLRERCRGWRAGLVTSDRSLAAATALPFLPPDPPVSHGGIRVTLFRTGPL